MVGVVLVLNAMKVGVVEVVLEVRMVSGSLASVRRSGVDGRGGRCDGVALAYSGLVVRGARGRTHGFINGGISSVWVRV